MRFFEVFLMIMFNLVLKSCAEVRNISTNRSSNFSTVHTPTSPQDDKVGIIFSNVTLYFLIGLFSLVTVVGNVLIILAVIIFNKLHKIPNMFIVSLASADLIMGGIVVPLGAHSVVGTEWLLGSFACDLWTSIDVLSVTASICTLCSISLDRYVAITMPFEYSSRMTRARARFIIGFIWIVSAAIAFIPINMGWWKTNNPDDEKCYDDPKCCAFIINKTYAVVSSCVSFYVPLFIMVFSYSIVFRIALKKRNNIRNRRGMYRRPSMPGTKLLLWGRGEYRAVFTMGIIMGTFCICWLPFFIINIAEAFCKCIPQTAFLVLNWLGYANSCFNPIVYCHSKEFRSAFKRLLFCGICRDGYERTKRASLAVSYTPTASGRSSIRTESSFFLPNFLSGGNSNRGRSGRTSTVSNKCQRMSPVSQSNRRISNGGENARYFYGHRINRTEGETTSFSTNSIETESSASNQLLPRLDETAENENVSDLENTGSNIVSSVSASDLLPVLVGRAFNPVSRENKSKNSWISLTPDVCKKILFKTSSCRDINKREMNSDVCRQLITTDMSKNNTLNEANLK